MKKTLCIILVAVIAFTVCACTYNSTQIDRKENDDRKDNDERKENDERMEIVFNDGFAIIYRDNETGVHYLCRAHTGMCMMVNADGTPYTGEEDDD